MVHLKQLNFFPNDVFVIAMVIPMISRDSDVQLAQEHAMLSLKKGSPAEEILYKAAVWEEGRQLPLHLLLLLFIWGNNLPRISSVTANFLILQTM